MKYFRYVQRPIDYDEQALPIDPYIFGLWLGDGHSAVPALTTVDIRGVKRGPVRDGRPWPRVRWQSKPKPRVTEVRDGEYDATWTIFVAGRIPQKHVLDALRTLGVYKNKHIPDMYP